MDRHRLDADPDPDPNFHVDASQGPDPDWHPNFAVPHADPTPSFTYAGKSDFSYFWSQHCHITMFYFSLSVKCVKCVQYFGQHIEIFWKKVYFINFFVCLELIPIQIWQNDTDPTRSRSGP